MQFINDALEARSKFEYLIKLCEICDFDAEIVENRATFIIIIMCRPWTEWKRLIQIYA